MIPGAVLLRCRRGPCRFVGKVTYSIALKAALTSDEMMVGMVHGAWCKALRKQVQAFRRALAIQPPHGVESLLYQCGVRYLCVQET